ncbi:MAG: serine/threonine protein kinase [Segetibacter sp.]|jgi:serine/threonine protein kinase|nr:serine/threonine protein kinase [Segetibacter sp.]
MVKFKLSGNITVAGIDDSDSYAVPLQYQKDHYILYDQRRDKEFLINATVKYFIDKFSFPKNEAEVLDELASDIKGDRALIEETCSSFFKFLCNKRILLPENTVEQVFAPMPLYKEGDEINNLTILEVLSDRQYIDIYKVVDNTSSCVLVIKFLNGKKITDTQTYENELSELQGEYRTLRKLDHVSSICRAYSFITSEEHRYAYITLEYIQGVSLSHYLDETEALNQADCFQIMASILQAFSSLHSAGVIHGDIHSSNVMVLENKTIKIIDLGLSRNIETDKNEVVSFGGVNFYMPPERINTTSIQKYLKEPDLYSDVYQIGLLMYLVLYNTLPFDGFIWEELATNIKEANAVFADVSFLNVPVPEKLILILQKCLQKIPYERYKDAAEILADFKKLVF